MMLKTVQGWIDRTLSAPRVLTLKRCEYVACQHVSTCQHLPG